MKSDQQFLRFTTAVLTVTALLPANAGAGAYIFAGEGNEDRVTHPSGYTGTGGTLEVKVCIDPTSPSSPSMTLPVQNAIRSWNSMTPVTGNLLEGGANNIPGGAIDWESAVMHEVGHCISLAHVNLASESGLTDPDRNYTKTTNGVNNVYDRTIGADNVRGTSDDARGDDVNLHWFRKSTNSPFGMDDTVDSTTYSRDVADLPAGHTFVTNADRTVSTAIFALAKTEAVMQQGQFSDEDQRRATHDDVATLKLGESGLDMIAGNADDYQLKLVYGGISADASCQLNVKFDDGQTGFAVCKTSGSFVGVNHLRITAANVYFNTGYNWFFNTEDNSAKLTVTKAGTGSGTVTSGRPGISCGGDCEETWSKGAIMKLTATATAGSTFAGWSGGCTGATATTSITVNANTTCTATFTAVTTRTLTVNKTGAGTGTVTSAPAGITCGADCTEAYGDGTAVTLTAAAAAGSTFTGWSGDCAGAAATSMVTMSADRTCGANFDLTGGTNHTLTVSRAGVGVGDVVSTPAGITCGADCTESYVSDTNVSLAATAMPGSVFTMWGGDCAGTVSPASVVMSQARTCSAEFASACGDSNEPNGTPATAAAVTTANFTTSPTGTCTDLGGDLDLFSFSCTAGDLLLGSALVELQGSSLDPKLSLLDSNGASVKDNSAVGAGVRDARVSHTLTSGGTYYLEVEGLSGTQGNYSLRAYCRTLGAGTSFGDVPAGHQFKGFIEAFSAAGITSGCGGGLYCPDAVVTRGQMAVFIVRALGLAADASAAPVFGDVAASHPFFGFIQVFSNLGITAGCGGGNFCPDDPVSRGQMAVFLIRALGNASRADLGPSFGDVAATHSFYAFIEAFAVQGITSGCGGGEYCPDAPVTRGQMAVFIVRAFGLPVAGGFAPDIPEGRGVASWILDHPNVERLTPKEADRVRAARDRTSSMRD